MVTFNIGQGNCQLIQILRPKTSTAAAYLYNILFDCGTLADFPYRLSDGKTADKDTFLKKMEILLRKPEFDLVIVSHPDRDHKSLIPGRIT